MQLLPFPIYAIAEPGETPGLPHDSSAQERAAHQNDFASLFDVAVAETIVSNPVIADDATENGTENTREKPDGRADENLGAESEPEPEPSEVSTGPLHSETELKGTGQSLLSDKALIPEVMPAASRVAAASSLDDNDLHRSDAYSAVSLRRPSDILVGSPSLRETAESGMGELGLAAPKSLADEAQPFGAVSLQPNAKAAHLETRIGHDLVDPHSGASKSLNLGVHIGSHQGREPAAQVHQAVAQADINAGMKASHLVAKTVFDAQMPRQIEADALMHNAKLQKTSQAFQGAEISQQSNALPSSARIGSSREAFARPPVRQLREAEESVPLHSLSSDDAKLKPQKRSSNAIVASQVPGLPAQIGFEMQHLRDDTGKLSAFLRDETDSAGEVFETHFVRSAAPQGGAVLSSAALSEARSVLIVREAMAEMRTNGQSEIELTLSPKELGKLRFVMSPSEGQMIVQVFAERQETLEAMRRHVEAYANALSAEGFGSAQFEFGRDTGGSAAGPRVKGLEDGAETSMEQAALLSPADIETARKIWLGPNKQLDIRL